MKSEFILLIHMMVILTLAAANPAAIEKDATTGVVEMILIPAESTGADYCIRVTNCYNFSRPITEPIRI